MKTPTNDVCWECDHWTYPEGYRGPADSRSPVRCEAKAVYPPNQLPRGWEERQEQDGPCGLTEYYRTVTRQYCPAHVKE